MILRLLQSSSFLKKLYFNKLGKAWVKKKLGAFEEHLPPRSEIIDIGCGNGLVTHELREKGHDVTPVDIAKLSYSKKVSPVVYNGKHIPFKSKSFNFALLLTVLHHTENPEKLLKEAARVAGNVIIIEDVYNNTFQKHLTFAMDTFVNLFYSKCTYQNKNDTEWKQLFEKLNLKLILSKEQRILLFFRQAVYILKSEFE